MARRRIDYVKERLLDHVSITPWQFPNATLPDFDPDEADYKRLIREIRKDNTGRVSITATGTWIFPDGTSMRGDADVTAEYDEDGFEFYVEVYDPDNLPELLRSARENVERQWTWENLYKSLAGES